MDSFPSITWKRRISFLIQQRSALFRYSSFWNVRPLRLRSILDFCGSIKNENKTKLNYWNKRNNLLFRKNILPFQLLIYSVFPKICPAGRRTTDRFVAAAAAAAAMSSRRRPTTFRAPSTTAGSVSRGMVDARSYVCPLPVRRVSDFSTVVIVTLRRMVVRITAATAAAVIVAL